MTELDARGPEGPGDAELRVAEIADLFRRTRTTLDHMIGTVGTPNAQTPKAIVTKLNELQSVHLKVLDAEEAFYAKQEESSSGTEIDFDAVRAEIGGQLDRIRKAIAAE